MESVSLQLSSQALDVRGISLSEIMINIAINIQPYLLPPLYGIAVPKEGLANMMC